MKVILNIIKIVVLAVLAAALSRPNLTRAQSEAEPPLLDVTNINGFVIVSHIDDINTNGVAGVRGTKIIGPQFLKKKGFLKVMSPFLGRPLTVGTLNQIQTNIVRYCRHADHPVVDVFFQVDPVTVVLDGVVQIAVVEGKVGKILVVDASKPRIPVVTFDTNSLAPITNYVGVPYTNGWFSSKTIRHQVHMRPGDSIEQDKLLDDINWLDRNPFREVTPAYNHGDIGQTDVELRVKDKDGKDALHPLPLKVFAGVDDSGNNLLGNYHTFAGVDWGNAFWLDDQLNYTYTTDIDFDRYRVHSGNFVAPLPWWHHTLTVFGYYADVKPDLSQVNAASFNENGYAYDVSARYTIPLFNLGNYSHELSLGADYKSGNNNLFFNVSSPQPLFPASVFQSVGTYRGSVNDRLGETTVSAQGFYSPGKVGSDDDDLSYQRNTGNPYISSKYYYVNFDGSRTFKLPLLQNWLHRQTPDDFNLYVHGTGQYTSERLLPGEEFGLGGWSSIRGYDERVASGDKGYVINTELRLPMIRKSDFNLQVYGFYDYGSTHFNNFSVASGDTYHSIALASAGPGVRANWGKYLEARLDYGVELRKISSSTLQAEGDSAEKSRFHFSVTASF